MKSNILKNRIKEAKKNGRLEEELEFQKAVELRMVEIRAEIDALIKKQEELI